MLRKENKQNSIRKTQLEKKINDVEQMASEITKQKAEFLQYKDNAERKTTETLLILNKENESVSAYYFFFYASYKNCHKTSVIWFISVASEN